MAKKKLNIKKKMPNGGKAPIKGTKEQDFRINTEDNSWLTKIDNVMSAPARGATYLLTGKYQDPSDALGIDAKEHPYLKLATDLTLDPMNLLGLGIVSKVGKGAKVIDVLNDGTKVVRELGKLEKPFEITQGGQKYVKNIYDVAHNAQQTNKNLKRFEGLSEVVENSEKIRRGQLLGSATASINDILVQNKKPVQPIIYEPEIITFDSGAVYGRRGDEIRHSDGTWHKVEKLRPKEQPINIQSSKPDLLQGNNQQLEFNPIGFQKGSYFTRPRQSQEIGEDLEYFDKKTGRKLEFGGNINELDMAKNGKKIKLKKAEIGKFMPNTPLEQDPEFRIGDQGFNEQPYTPVYNPNEFNPSLTYGLENYNQSRGYNFNSPSLSQNEQGQYNTYKQRQSANPWQDVGQQMIPSLDNLQNLPKATIPNITDSKWWAKADKKFQKGQELAVKAGQSVISGFTGGMGGGAMGGGKMPSFGKANGGFIPKKMQGGGLMSWLDAASYGTGAAASFAGAGMDTTGALLDTLGSANINNQVKQWENQNARQFAFNKAENLPPIEEFGYQFQGRNNALMEHGGMTKYKSYNNGGAANVEVENLETIATPDGIIEDVHGATHNQGGIDMLLPEGSKVFSEKLKHPETKKSYAKMAKKFETKKDIKNMEYPFADTTSLFTSELNIAKKKELSDELFAEMEMNKITGKHGKAVKNSTEKDYKMKYGGMKKAQNGLLTQRGYDAIDQFENTKGTAQGTSMNMGAGYSKTKEKEIESFVKNSIGLDAWNRLPESVKVQAYSWMFNHGTDNSVWKGLAQAADRNTVQSFDPSDTDIARQKLPVAKAIEIVKNAKFDDKIYDNYVNQILPQQYQSIADNYSGGFEAGQNAFNNSWKNRSIDIDRLYNSNNLTNQNIPTTQKLNRSGYLNGVWTGDATPSYNPVLTPGVQQLSTNWNAMTDFKSLEDYAKAVGYTGKIDDKNPAKTSLEIQKFVGQKYPDLVKKYHDTYGQPNAKTPYDSKLGVRWQSIAKDIQALNAPKTTLQPVSTPVKQSDVAAPINDRIKGGGQNFKQFMPQTKVPFYQFDSFQRDPITSYTIDPQYVNPRYLDINPELSDINRDVNAITALTPDRTGANIANIANIANQARAAKQRAFGQKYQYDKQQDQWAEGTNAQAKMTTDLQNLNNYIKNVRDPQLMRESIITQQKGINNEAELSRTEQYNRDANTMAWMDKYYNPSANSQMPIFDPYTGEKLIDVDKIAKYGKKIKLKAKIKKK